MKTPLKKDFIDSIKELPGIDTESLIQALDSPPEISIRFNRRKTVDLFKDNVRVPWCESGVYLDERPDFILDPLWHAGAYYVQDASSMIYETVIKKLLEKFELSNKNSGLKVLDLCAAPGGKTTAMINALPDGADITANEISPKRVIALKENLSRWGYPNITVTNEGSDYYASKREQYDIVAIDAPCSGEGMMRKDEDARAQWSQELVESCASLQKGIIQNAVKTLNPGGFLIYSTCTFNRKENEENAEFITSLGLKPVDLHFPSEWNIQKGIGTDLPVYRFLPHKTRGEGLFLSVFQKPNSEEVSFKHKSFIQKRNYKSKKDKQVNQKKEERTPGIEEILSVDFDYNRFPHAELDKEEALAYLRRESIILPTDIPRGIVIVTYNGLPLGAVKNIGSRANNLLPKNRRILKR